MTFNLHSTSHSQRLRWVALRALLLVCLGTWTAWAVPVDPSTVKDRTESKPKRLDGVQLDEKLGDTVPLGIAFTDTSGNSVTLGELVDGRRPTILTFNYSDCPMLCSLQLNGLVDGLKQITRTAGDDFQIVTISIDPKETIERAKRTKQRYLSNYGRPRAAAGWHFLIGPEERTRAVADAVGFGYVFNEARKEWLHTAAAIVLTPEGKVARYLYGIEYHPETLNLSVVEASEGKIGSTIDRLVLYCFHYDESEGRYAPVAMNIMRVGAGGVAVALAIFLSIYWMAERRKRLARAAADPLQKAAKPHLAKPTASKGSSSWPGATEPNTTES